MAENKDAQYDILLCAKIIDILKNEWSNYPDFDHVWLGYDTLYDILKEKGSEYSIKELKRGMQILKKHGKVELTTLYDDEYKLCGRGWVICE